MVHTDKIAADIITKQRLLLNVESLTTVLMGADCKNQHKYERVCSKSKSNFLVERYLKVRFVEIVPCAIDSK